MIIKQFQNEGAAEVRVIVQTTYGMHNISINVGPDNSNPSWLVTDIEFEELRKALNEYSEKYLNR